MAYESIQILNGYIQFILTIASGLCVIRIIHLCINAIGNPDESAQTGKKIKNIVIALIICLSIDGFIEMLKRFYM